jgi:hypothetical protein
MTVYVLIVARNSSLNLEKATDDPRKALLKRATCCVLSFIELAGGTTHHPADPFSTALVQLSGIMSYFLAKIGKGPLSPRSGL